MTYVPGLLLVATIASRSEIPSGPGFAIRALTLDVSPLATSCDEVTAIVTTSAAFDIEGTKTANATREQRTANPIGERLLLTLLSSLRPNIVSERTTSSPPSLLRNSVLRIHTESHNDLTSKLLSWVARHNPSVTVHWRLGMPRPYLVSKDRPTHSPTGGLASGLPQWARSIWSSRTS